MARKMTDKEWRLFFPNGDNRCFPNRNSGVKGRKPARGGRVDAGSAHGVE